ncbi:hypothetical protein OG589_06000 [Sphaerisporangium sp. NBC_01403]|uniref:hypothetical protein n=1 Tax=Sphaerisporangium sp. NBC_01403 TaxID=2903599 RepID=UPI0032468B18
MEMERAIKELGGVIYTALRDDDLSADPARRGEGLGPRPGDVIELACLLEEIGRSSPAVRELLERPTAELTPEDVARLGRRLLQEIHYQPSFDDEPGLWATLAQALLVVERDVRATGISGPLRLTVPDWDIGGHARVEFRNAFQGNGIPPGIGADDLDALVSVADATQEVVMEMIWAAWPTCPEHRLGLYAGSERGTAIWRCGGTGTGMHTVAPVGRLTIEHR